MDNPIKAVLRPRNPGEGIKVAETVLKRRDRNIKAAAARAQQIAAIRKNAKSFKSGKLNIIRAERLIKNHVVRQSDQRRLKNQFKKKKPRTYKGRMLAVARNGRLGGSTQVKKTLKSLGLGQRHSLVFVPNNPDSVHKLAVCKPFLFWGHPSFKTVFNVVHKKAMFRDSEHPGQKTLLSDNTLIEKHLGDLGVLCTEDLAHTLHTCSKNFGAVSKRLWPVPLGDAKKASGMVHDAKFTFGDLGAGDTINTKLATLLGD